MSSVQWVQPSPLWERWGNSPKPWLAEFHGDRFVPEFLELMGGHAPGRTPADLDGHRPTPTGNALKLFQPLHGWYYLVTGSLVCRQLGLPDRSVARQDGERTSFVLRRLAPTALGFQEQGWARGVGWQPVAGPTLLPGEERLPMHPVPVCSGAAAGKRATAPLGGCEGRTVHFGYVPVDSREKYIEKYLTPSGNPTADLQAYAEALAAEPSEGDYRLGEFDARILSVWRGLFVDPVTGAALPFPLSDEQKHPASLYLILDLGDFMQRTLPGLFDAIVRNDRSAVTGKRRDLFDELGRIYASTATPTATGSISLAAALRELRTPIDYYPLVHGEGTEPTKRYNLRDAPPAPPAGAITVNAGYLGYKRANGVVTEGQFHLRVREALEEEKAERKAKGEPWLPAGGEIAGLLADQVKLDPPTGDRYCLRLVYEYDPCPPVLSDPSDPFTFAKVLDPDAPTRHLRIELPSLKDLRKFKHGVGMEMPPDLRNVMDRVNKGMLDGGGLAAGSGGWELGMICSFSISIITLVAFIVMFIFLILLNIVFWWLPFLKICLPIPKKK